MLHPVDCAAISDSILAQIHASDGNMDYVEYRIIRKDGSVRRGRAMQASKAKAALPVQHAPRASHAHERHHRPACTPTCPSPRSRTRGSTRCQY